MTQIEWLTDTYGARLEKVGAVDKTALLAVLAFWQAQDTEFQATYDEDEYEPFTLNDAIQDYPADLPSEAEEILNRLVGISDETCFTLMVAIANQVRDGIFAEEND
jgi:hypothetical protein